MNDFHYSLFTNLALTVSITSSTVIASMQRGLPWMHGLLRHGLHPISFLMTIWPSPYGPVNPGLVGPNRAMTGVLSAAAICIGPESLVTRRSTHSSKAVSVFNDVFPAATAGLPETREDISSARGISSLPPRMIIPAFNS